MELRNLLMCAGVAIMAGWSFAPAKAVDRGVERKVFAGQDAGK